MLSLVLLPHLQLLSYLDNANNGISTAMNKSARISLVVSARSPLTLHPPKPSDKGISAKPYIKNSPGETMSPNVNVSAVL